MLKVFLLPVIANVIIFLLMSKTKMMNDMVFATLDAAFILVVIFNVIFYILPYDL